MKFLYYFIQGLVPKMQGTIVISDHLMQCQSLFEVCNEKNVDLEQLSFNLVRFSTD